MRMYEVIDDKQRTLRDQLDQQMATSSALSQSADAAAKTIKVRELLWLCCGCVVVTCNFVIVCWWERYSTCTVIYFLCIFFYVCITCATELFHNNRY